MEITDAYFYLDNISEDLKRECKEAILFKLDDHKLVWWTGYIWIKSENYKWSEKNYRKSNVKLYKVGDNPGTIYRNMIWFYGTKKDCKELGMKAIELFLEDEHKTYIDLLDKARYHSSQIEFLNCFTDKNFEG